MSEPKQMISGFPSAPIDASNRIVGPVDIYPSNDPLKLTEELLRQTLIDAAKFKGIEDIRRKR